MVHRSWRVAQQATEMRKESYVVMAQRSPGRGQEGEISPGAIGGTLDEKSECLSMICFSMLETVMTDMHR